MTTALPTPPREPAAAAAWVRAHLADCVADEPTPSPAFRGGQGAADAALAAFDVTGYAAARNEVWPEGRRGASRLSPYVRHGLLDLPRLWAAVADAPVKDRDTFRAELGWQEYARHLYARLGPALAAPLRGEPVGGGRDEPDPWDPRMACMDLATTELRRDGWVVNQARMWLA
ncbi:MAG: FAD-binding domain-containing protein, partial [Actinomycetota bacterium]